METIEPRPFSRYFLFAILIVIIVGTALSLVDIGSESLWLDEAFTWYFVGQPWDQALQTILKDGVNPPAYYVFVKALTPNDTLSEVALRFPSVIAQIAGIAFASYLGYQLGGPVGGLVAGLLWATHPLTVWMSRDARPYALAAAMGAAAVALFVAYNRSPSTRNAIAAIVILALGLLTHYFFFVLAAALVLLTLTNIRRTPEGFRRWTVITLIALIPLAIWLAFYFSQPSPTLGIGWIRTPHLADLPLTLWNLASGYAGIFDAVSLAFGVAVLLMVGLAAYFGDRSLTGKLLLVGLVIPLAAVWVISQRRSVYMDRYFVVLMPFVVGLAALGAAAATKRLTWRWGMAAVAAAGLLAVLLAGSSVHRAQKFEKEDWRGVVAYSQEQGFAADYALSEPEITLPLSYYGFNHAPGSLSPLVPACSDSCWWIIRQPYTATHALTQSVQEAGHEQEHGIPEGCVVEKQWISPSGLSVWELDCVG